MAMIGELRKGLKRRHCPLEVMLVCARWSAAYPLNLRHIEKMIAKSAVSFLSTPRDTAGQWKYWCWAVDKAGDTVDFLLTAKPDKVAARRFLERAINLHGLPEKITIHKSGANTAAIHSVNADACLDIELRQCKYLNNFVDKDRRVVKGVTAPILGLK
jgi:transposase-like protein